MIKQEIERLHDLLNGIKSVPERIGQGGRILRVLVACEESQAVCKAFRRLGHEAYSCDIQPCSGGRPEWHIQADALEIIKIKWDLIIAHPPCTYLSNGYGGCHHSPLRMWCNPLTVPCQAATAGKTAC